MRIGPLRNALSPPLAVLLALAIAGQATASAWSPPVTVAPSSFSAGLATLADRIAVAIYERCVGRGFCINEVALRRSTDSGQTWHPPLLIAGDDGDMAALAGRGRMVDVVWRGSGLFYRRSSDSAKSFGNERVLTHETTVREPTVARGPAGLVAVAWGEWPGFVDRITVRVSTDSGQTFGPERSWRTTGTDSSSIAVGDGVVYLAYLDRGGIPVIRRSLDAGATWSAALKLTTTPAYSAPALAAEGSDAYVAYEGSDALYRSTHDRGGTWSRPAAINPGSTSASQPSLSLHEGVVRALFETSKGLFYTRLANTGTWTDPERIARQWVGNSFVGFVGRPIVLYETDTGVYSTTRIPH